jgi:hypothetical protein
MPEILTSATFWFGAFLLALHQYGRFSELSAIDDPAVREHAGLIPDLRTRDFAGRLTFIGTLAAFLAATLILYLIFCLVAPTVLLGWAQVSGTAASGEAAIAELEAFVNSVPYPLYIAAAFMGLTQPAIPILSSLGNMQRDLFHALIGVPRRVVNTSTYFCNQIFARSTTRKQLAKEVVHLASDAWQERIDTYADSVFYRHQLRRLKLDDPAEIQELLQSSSRELKSLVIQLVYVASLATVRESDRKFLGRLAEDLKVSMPPHSRTTRNFLAGAVLFLIGATLLWTALPMFHGLVTQFLISEPKFWPKEIVYSGQYVMSQTVPMFVAVAVALATSNRIRRQKSICPAGNREAEHWLSRHFERYVTLFLAVVIGIVCYDLAQAFFDYGYFKEGTKGSFLTFAQNHLPFYLLHSFVSLTACFVVLLYIDELAEKQLNRPLRFTLMLVGSVAAASLFYALVRLHYQFKERLADGIDFVILMVALNVIAALLALAAARFNARHRIELDRDAAVRQEWNQAEGHPVAPAVS